MSGRVSRPTTIWSVFAVVFAVLFAVVFAAAVGIGPAGEIEKAVLPVGSDVARADGEKPDMPAACAGDGTRCAQQLTVGSGLTLPTLANFPLAGSPGVTHALVVIHGAGRNEKSAFTSITNAAEKSGVLGSTLVLAPHFQADEDDPDSGEPVWTDDGWKQGDEAVSPQNGPSSFAVLDEIITMLADRNRFAGLRRITVVGHSAGGQYAQRYAAFGLAPNEVGGVDFDYVIGNPSSFVYFDPARPSPEGGGFAVPPSSECADYDSYKYGMQGRSGYTARLTADQAEANYVSRRVTIINGAEDTVDIGNLDTGCEADLQGVNRAVRGENFIRRIREKHPNAAHDRVVIDGVDHDKVALFESPLARRVLFGEAVGGG